MRLYFILKHCVSRFFPCQGHELLWGVNFSVGGFLTSYICPHSFTLPCFDLA